MNLFNRLKTGITLTKDSLLLIKHHPKLGIFPLISGITGLAFLTIFLGVTFGLVAVSLEAGAVISLFTAYLALTFISSFFTAGLVHQTKHVLQGGNPSLRNGIREAWKVKKPLLIWAAISATVGILINMIENSDTRTAQVFGLIFGAAWTLLTFFIIPVIVFEKTSVKEMFSRSAGTFKQTWGETPISLFGVQIISILTLLPFALTGGLLLWNGLIISGISIVLVGALFSFLVGQTLQGVIKTVLYIYAKTGSSPDEFNNVNFDDLTRPSKRSKTPSTAATSFN